MVIDQGEYDVAVIGMAGRFPGASSVGEFWENLCSGVESIHFLTDEELSAAGVSQSIYERENYVRAASFLESAFDFDCSFFGVSPKDAVYMDPQHRLFLESCWCALESGGYDVSKVVCPVGVFGGAAMNTYILNSGLGSRFNNEYLPTLIGNDNSFLTTRVSYKLNLTGPSMTVQTACSTSLVAVHAACQSLTAGECDMALAGGVSVRVPDRVGYEHNEGSIFSSDGHCRPFDAAASGTLFGSGVGVVLLKPLAAALEDGDTVHAVIKGTAVNNDGASKVDYTAPSVDSQSAVVAEALAVADVSADTISYVETHGTGTNLGDPIEIAALSRGFRSHTDARQFCAIGSVKSNIGHLDAAAGIAGLIKTVLSLKYGVIPPSLNFDTPNKNIDFESTPFFVNSELRGWESDNGVRRACVNSLGIGGTNAHVVLQEPPPVDSGDSTQGADAAARLVVLSARDDNAMAQACSELSEFMLRNSDVPMRDIAYTLQTGRKNFPLRRVAVGKSHIDISGGLKSRGASNSPIAEMAMDNPKLVFAFPGMGGQYKGMAGALIQAEPVFKEAVFKCLEILRGLTDVELRHYFFDHSESLSGDEKEVDRPEVSSLGIVVTEYALARLWMSWGIEPAALIGHSLGEYVAAALSGVLTLEDALRLVVARARLVETTDVGGMLSVSIAEADAVEHLVGTSVVALVNSPQSCVISGGKHDITEVANSLARANIDYRVVKTDRAWHSSLLDSVLPEFRDCANQAKLAEPTIPVISNVSGEWLTDEEARDPEYWVKHLRSSVKFGQGVSTILSNEGVVVLEVGPNTALTSMIKQNIAFDSNIHTTIPSLPHRMDDMPEDQFALLALGRVWMAGGEPQWDSLYKTDSVTRRATLPTYPFQREQYKYESDQRENTVISNRRKVSRSDWLYSASWKSLSRSSTNRTGVVSRSDLVCDGATVVFCGDGVWDQGLISGLTKNGHKVVSVCQGSGFSTSACGNAFTLRVGSLDDYCKTVSSIQEQFGAIERVIHCWLVDEGFDPAQRDTEARLNYIQETGYQSFVNIVQALISSHVSSEVKLTFVTTQAFDVLGGEVCDPAKSTLVGPLKVVPQEYPNLVCQCVDLSIEHSLTSSAAEIVAIDVISEIESSIVALRGNRLWVNSYENIVRSEHRLSGESMLRADGVYLITGGTGVLGLELAAHISRQVENPTLVLASRSAETLDGTSFDGECHSQKAFVETLRKNGAHVKLYSCDVADKTAVTSMIEYICHEYGRLNGVVHAAGVVDQAEMYTVEKIGDRESAAHFAPKIFGTIALASAVADVDTDFCVAMSSISTILGGIGHTAYASANQFMDSYLALVNEQCGHAKWTVIDWDIWKTAESEASLKLVGGASMVDVGISVEDGLELFNECVQLPVVEGPIIISSTDLSQRISEWVRSASSTSISVDELAFPKDMSGDSDGSIESRVATIWCRHLGIENVDRDVPFADLGGHSLMATQIIADLRAEFSVVLSIKDMFSVPTVARLAALIDEKLQESNEQFVGDDDITQLIEGMTDEEVAALLSEQDNLSKR